jgi:hypothetical protein
MYDDYDLEDSYSNDYNLEDDSYIDEDYDRNDNGYEQLAYRHYA